VRGTRKKNLKKKKRTEAGDEQRYDLEGGVARGRGNSRGANAMFKSEKRKKKGKAKERARSRKKKN